MKILGIDPGTIRLGYCVLELERGKISLVDAGFLKINSKILQHQITELVEGIDQILKDHKIDAVAIEDIFFAHNPKTVLKLAQFRGALALKILLEIGNFAEYTPIALILLAFMEINKGNIYLIHALALIFLVGRVIHAYGLSQMNENLLFRLIGMMATISVIALSAFANIYLSISS